MTGLLPLFLLWAANRGTTSPGLTASTFAWPTPASPPPMPPLPAFQRGGTPADANTGTPLQSLAQPTAKHKPPPVARSPAVPTSSALERAKRAAKAKLKNAALSRARGASASFGPPMPAQQSVRVLELQKIITAHGGKLKRDGLYGPITANAWGKLANSKGLPPTISRGGPTIAKVVPSTYEALKVPPAP